MRWRCGEKRFELGKRPLIMGILNVTPDSFSDGYPQLDQAITQAQKLIDQGADILDVGGESTRPGSDPIPLDVELGRVVPVVEEIAKRFDTAISVDTQKAEVAREAVGAGAHIINHVSASLDFKPMIQVLTESEVGYVAMHMRDRPKHMQNDVQYDDVIQEITTQLAHVRDVLEAAGVARERLLFDPGVGFGKRLEHNLEIMRRTQAMAAVLERPLLMGVSRKSWMCRYFETDDLPFPDRDLYTTVASLAMAREAVAVHRVHRVDAPVRAFQLFDALT